MMMPKWIGLTPAASTSGQEQRRQDEDCGRRLEEAARNQQADIDEQQRLPDRHVQRVIAAIICCGMPLVVISQE